jgi:hypothetical protein
MKTKTTAISAKQEAFWKRVSWKDPFGSSVDHYVGNRRYRLNLGYGFHILTCQYIGLCLRGKIILQLKDPNIFSLTELPIEVQNRESTNTRNFRLQIKAKLRTRLQVTSQSIFCWGSDYKVVEKQISWIHLLVTFRPFYTFTAVDTK